MRSSWEVLQQNAGAGRRRQGLCVLASVVLASTAAPARAADPAFVILSPSEELVEAPGDALIAISILDPDHVVDPASIRFTIDGRDLTSSAQVSPDLVTYVPSEPMLPGPHRIELTLRAIGGAELPGLRHEFRTEGVPMKLEKREGRFVETRGRLTLETLADDLSGPGVGLRQEPNQTSTGRLDLSGKAVGWNYSGMVFMTSDEASGFQPRNRYSLHLDRNWLGFDFGDVNYRFSEFVLQGKRARGVGGYLRMGDAEVRLVYGDINRAIEGQASVDTIGGVPDTTIVGDSFERTLLGMRIEVGQGKSYQSALDLIRVRDDVNSIRFGRLPKDNVILGTNHIWAPFNRRIILEGDAAVSFLTDDISGGAMTKDQLDSLVGGAELPFDPKDYEDIFIMNLSTTPLDPSSLSNLAWRAGARGNVLGNLFELRYQQVGSTFKSLAAPSTQNDKQGFRVTDSIRLLKRRMELAGEFETFSDNLQDDKAFTTDTGIRGVSATFVPGRVDLKNVSLAFRQYRRENDAPADSLARIIDETTNSFRVGTGYHFWWLQGYELTANYLYSNTDAEQAGGDAKQNDWMLGYSTAFESWPLGAELQFGVSKTEYTGSEVKYTTLGIGGTYRFMQDRLESFGSVVQVSGDATGGLISADKSTWNAGARYRMSERTSLMARLALVRFSDEATSTNDYDENVFNLRLVQDF